MAERGWQGTTFADICRVAGISNGVLTYHFKSKEEIGEGVLDYHHGLQRAMFTEAPFNRQKDPLKRLYGLLDFIGETVVKSQGPQGCLLGNLTQELALSHPRIRTSCEEKLSNFGGLIESMLKEAKSKYHPRTDFDPQSVATLFVSLMQGSMLLAKARQDKSVMAGNLEHFRCYIETLFGNAIKD